MWSIGEVKRLAWERLKVYYWPAFAVCVICGLASGGGGGSSASHSNQVSGEHIGVPGTVNLSPHVLAVLAMSVFGVLAVAFLLSMVLKIFVGNPMEVGKCRFFMESRSFNRSAGIDRLFWVFKSGHYLNVVKVMFFRDLFTSLWFLLLVIPGIVKSYEYMMIPYILAENPDAGREEVFKATKEMMEGNKFQVFCLEWSFIGWYILGVVLCLVGTVFVVPYEEASKAEVYAALRKRAGGFPFRGFGGNDGETNSYENYGSGYSSSFDDDRYKRNDDDMWN